MFLTVQHCCRFRVKRRACFAERCQLLVRIQVICYHLLCLSAINDGFSTDSNKNFASHIKQTRKREIPKCKQNVIVLWKNVLNLPIPWRPLAFAGNVPTGIIFTWNYSGEENSESSSCFVASKLITHFDKRFASRLLILHMMFGLFATGMLLVIPLAYLLVQKVRIKEGFPVLSGKSLPRK